MKRITIILVLLLLVIPSFLFATGSRESPQRKRIPNCAYRKLEHPMFDNTFIGMQKAAKDFGGVRLLW